MSSDSPPSTIVLRDDDYEGWTTGIVRASYYHPEQCGIDGQTIHIEVIEESSSYANNKIQPMLIVISPKQSFE